MILEGDDEDEEDEALLMVVFDHESPRSPFGRDDGNREWPGMFDGLPDDLRERLPDRGDGPLAVSTWFWFTGGSWQEGQPEPVAVHDDYFAGDPGGADHVLAVLLDPQVGVEEMLGWYEQMEFLDEAMALVRSIAPE